MKAGSAYSRPLSNASGFPNEFRFQALTFLPLETMLVSELMYRSLFREDLGSPQVECAELDSPKPTTRTWV